MAKDAKLLAAIRANPQNVRFRDACRGARLLGLVHLKVIGCPAA